MKKQPNPRWVAMIWVQKQTIPTLTGISSGTDTQLHLAAKSGKKHKQNVNDDEKVVKNKDGEEEFLKSDETDEW